MMLNKINFSTIDDNTLDQAMNIFDCIPFTILDHYSKKFNIGTLDLCVDVLLSNKEWHMRLSHPMTYTTLEDIIHDFIGLANRDEHFVPRI